MNKLPKIFSLAVLVALVISVMPVTFAQDGIESVCLITDTGQVNDGSFSQYTYEGMITAAEDYDLETSYIETQAETDFEKNINDCIGEGAEVILTVGFLMADATLVAAGDNPDVYFIGIDQFHPELPSNYVGVNFREDQAAFLVGVLAALVAEDMDSDTIAGVYGIDIPPVKKYRNGFEQGARYINPDINPLGVYIDSFDAGDRGASAAQQFIGEGATVIFGAGGPTGSGGILAAAQEGVYVIGVDLDEYFTTFEGGETPGSEYLISSAMKRLDQGVYDMVEALATGDMDAWAGGSIYMMEAANDGVGFAPKHDSDIPDEYYEQVDEVMEALAAGDIETGVDPVSGDLMEDMDMEEEGSDS